MLVLVGYGGREANVMQQTRIIVEAEQQRSHEALVARITETADHAISRAQVFDSQ
jgi:hypothetical protein